MTGDVVLHRLVAQIGFILESVHTQGNPDIKNWFFWQTEDEQSEHLDVDSEQMEADRQFALEMMRG